MPSTSVPHADEPPKGGVSKHALYGCSVSGSLALRRADLAWRRIFAWPLFAPAVGAGHDHPGLDRHAAGMRHSPIDELARAIGTFDTPRRGQVEIDPRM